MEYFDCDDIDLEVAYQSYQELLDDMYLDYQELWGSDELDYQEFYDEYNTNSYEG